MIFSHNQGRNALRKNLAPHIGVKFFFTNYENNYWIILVWAVYFCSDGTAAIERATGQIVPSKPVKCTIANCGKVRYTIALSICSFSDELTVEKHQSKLFNFKKLRLKPQFLFGTKRNPTLAFNFGVTVEIEFI